MKNWLEIKRKLLQAENRAKRHIPMTMEDWSTRIDKFLLANEIKI